MLFPAFLQKMCCYAKTFIFPGKLVYSVPTSIYIRINKCLIAKNRIIFFTNICIPHDYQNPPFRIILPPSHLSCMCPPQFNLGGLDGYIGTTIFTTQYKHKNYSTNVFFNLTFNLTIKSSQFM